jgi:hypothetical protein
MLIARINTVMKEFMGVSGRTLFKLGFLTIESINTDSYRVKSNGLTYEGLLKLLRRAKIKPIFSATPYQTIQELITTLLLIGYRETIDHTNNGVSSSKTIRAENTESMLEDIFARDITLSSMGNKYFMIDLVLNKFYAEYARSADYSQIGRLLTDVLMAKIDKQVENLIRLGMGYQFIVSFRTMALKCLNNYLYATSDYGGSDRDYGAEFRGDLSDFIGGRGVFPDGSRAARLGGLNLQALRNQLEYYLEAYPNERITLDMLNDIFATLQLDQDDYNRFFEQFAEYRVTRNLNFGVGITPDTILKTRMDHVKRIANFFTYMAKTYGGTSQKIRIYGYAMRRDGLGYKKTDKNAYYPSPFVIDKETGKPVIDENTGKPMLRDQDSNMPANNLRYFELDFNKLDDFDYSLFLGAFLVDMQTFVVKTDGMAGNEFLFAFNALTGSNDIGDLHPTLRGEIKPCFLEDYNAGLKWSDNDAHNDLEIRFNEIMDRFKRDNFVIIHRYNDVNFWRACCSKISALRKFSALID